MLDGWMDGWRLQNGTTHDRGLGRGAFSATGLGIDDDIGVTAALGAPAVFVLLDVALAALGHGRLSEMRRASGEQQLNEKPKKRSSRVGA